MGGKNGRAAIFLDRDGTINEEIGYMDRLEKLRLIPGAAEAIRLINASGMKTVVVTNQSGVARGIFTESLVAEIHARLVEMLRAEGAFLDGIYFCPHHPTEGRGTICGDARAGNRRRGFSSGRRRSSILIPPAPIWWGYAEGHRGGGQGRGAGHPRPDRIRRGGRV